MAETLEPAAGLSPNSEYWWSWAVRAFLLGLGAEVFLGLSAGAEVGVGLGLYFAALSYLSHRRDFLAVHPDLLKRR